MSKSPDTSILDKILLAIAELSRETTSPIKYEDLYVRVYRKYPKVFMLRGYPEFIDTEFISKKIYTLRKNGLVSINRKFITITEAGRVKAELLSDFEMGLEKNDKKAPDIRTMTRDIEILVKQITQLEVFKLFLSGGRDKIVDTDFYRYIGATVRTERNEFSGRIKTIQDAMKKLKGNKDYGPYIDFNDFMFDRYKDLIKAHLSMGMPNRRKNDN